MSVRDMCDRTAGFYHVLSVFVVPSVSVESAMECQMTWFMKCFFSFANTGDRATWHGCSAMSDVARTRS